jgi:hypothetical protein
MPVIAQKRFTGQKHCVFELFRKLRLNALIYFNQFVSPCLHYPTHILLSLPLH